MAASVIRRIFVLLHRYIGLVITLFLITVGLTGCLLAFQPELNRLVTPHLFPAERGGRPLDLATLAERAQRILPAAQINLIDVGAPETVIVRYEPGKAADAESAVTAGYHELFLDPVSGVELGRRVAGTGLPTGMDNLMPFIFRLHYNLSLGDLGMWLLGIAALLWTIDCFVSFFLTLPARGRTRSSPATGVQRRSYWMRWKPAWLVKWQASAFRLNFDLHRAGGLWTWLALLIYAWSSVYMNLHDSVYAPATRLFLDYPAPYWELPRRETRLEQPGLDWLQAVGTAQRLMAEQAVAQGFTLDKTVSMRLDRARHLYIYQVRSSRDIQDRRGRTRLVLDANTGEMKQLHLPTGQHNGLTVTMWLNALHDANVFGLPYRIFVSMLGLLIVMLASTGVYVWWKKRRARTSSV
ncbi:MAG: PepSY domain-containing protein [Dechloromonas sp.]|nr:PepSY domain-containing protein [Dechloromonas sp.]